MRNMKKAFSLMEVITIIVLVGIIAGFMIPNYAKAITKADERNMVANLIIMRTAIEMYEEEGGTLGGWNSLNTINNNLEISILDPKATYDCGVTVASGCTATHPHGWAVQFHDGHSNGLVHCSAGTCPSCPNQPGNCE